MRGSLIWRELSWGRQQSRCHRRHTIRCFPLGWKSQDSGRGQINPEHCSARLTGEGQYRAATARLNKAAGQSFFFSLSFVPNLKFDQKKKKKISESVSIYFLQRAALTHSIAIESVTIQMGDFIILFFLHHSKSYKLNNTPELLFAPHLKAQCGRISSI